MNDLLRTRFFILLADTSQEVINTEMQDAYEDFVKQIVTISNSEDYTHIFRMSAPNSLQIHCRFSSSSFVLYVHVL